jgi:hypothetical protein
MIIEKKDHEDTELKSETVLVLQGGSLGAHECGKRKKKILKRVLPHRNREE